MFKLVLVTTLAILTTITIYSVSNMALAQEESQGEWIKQEVEVYMWHKLWERYSSCSLNNCYTSDPVLRATASTDMPPDLRPSFVSLILEDNLFTATYLGDECHCWEVLAYLTQDDDNPLVWTVWEKTGIVAAQ